MKKSKAKLLKMFVDYTCEQCHKKFSESGLEIHRINRGCVGGIYELRNCMVLCSHCHSLIHFNEF